jgi:hypothetical protein
LLEARYARAVPVSIPIACSALLLCTLVAGCSDDESPLTGGGGAAATTSTTTASGSSTGGAACTPGEQVPCYTGPADTAGVGTCAEGTAVCGADGTPEPECIGEVIPTTDHCRTPADEDCDGELSACTGDHVWSKRFGDGSGQNGAGVAVDSDGNTLLFGTYSGTLDLGGAPLTGGGAFVAKLDDEGNHLWSKSLSTSSVPPSPRAIATDRYDNVFLVGDFSSTVDFGGDPLISSGGSQDVFLVKLDSDGNHLWSQAFGDDAFQLGWGVAADSDGSVIITGEHNGTIDFGGGPLSGDPGQTRVFLAKFDEDGAHTWSRSFGGGSIQYVRGGVTTDVAHSVVLTGYFFGTIDFGGGPLTSIGQADVFVIKLDQSGELVWSKRFGSANGEGSQGIATDAANNIVVVGSSAGSPDFGGGPLPNAGEDDLFVAKLDPDGNHVWSRSFGDGADQFALDVATDPQGCVVVNGIFRGTVDFGGTPLVNAGDDDAYVVKLGIDGEHLWSRAFGDAERQFGYGVTADADGNVIVTGDLRLTIDFGGGPLTSSGDYDVFVARYAP